MTESPYSEQPDPQLLKEIAATARRLYAELNAEDQEGVAEVLRDIAESGRGQAVLLNAVAFGLDFARRCQPPDGLTLQTWLDLQAMVQREDAEAD